MKLFIFAALVPIIAAPAFAQDGLQGRLVACANIADAAQRHACFDGLVPELKQTGAAQFGAAQPKPSPLTAPVTTGELTKAVPAQVEPDRVSLTVTAMKESGDGKVRFTMENGQVWKQVDTTPVRFSGKGPWTAEIRKAALGSFLLTLNGGRAVRVERVN